MDYSYWRRDLCLIGLLCSQLTAVAYSSGAEMQLLHVTSDAVPGFTDFRLHLDEASHVVSMRCYFQDGDIQEFSLSQLQAGAVLMENSGFKVIKLIGKDLDPHHGGVIRMVYLTNGLLHAYQTLEMELVFNGMQWMVQMKDNLGHRAISQLFVKGRKFLGKFIGIEDILIQDFLSDDE